MTLFIANLVGGFCSRAIALRRIFRFKSPSSAKGEDQAVCRANSLSLHKSPSTVFERCADPRRLLGMEMLVTKVCNRGQILKINISLLFLSVLDVVTCEKNK